MSVIQSDEGIAGLVDRALGQPLESMRFMLGLLLGYCHDAGNEHGAFKHRSRTARTKAFGVFQRGHEA